ncbi:hypothetical protein M427DRAFT_58087 [Gonapodya prolifera JEL478]|uniref:F-box domain-containing protein n=1 Tax=Gonapodya prolifera (strain JEL478) TaxID=1344416 RepID=A0A139ABI7_GONPJ|nr:hypothetical protein M427DRAFT_58087 [Gonapodya prolifera JEL478]|eukprot:KXS13835.1 hypothetical protein M427DRAFT_58087 [Gonapodya prolifera JEL478]
MDTIPAELLVQILRRLPPRDFYGAAAIVCRRWSSIVRGETGTVPIQIDIRAGPGFRGHGVPPWTELAKAGPLMMYETFQPVGVGSGNSETVLKGYAAAKMEVVLPASKIFLVPPLVPDVEMLIKTVVEEQGESKVPTAILFLVKSVDLSALGDGRGLPSQDSIGNFLRAANPSKLVLNTDRIFNNPQIPQSYDGTFPHIASVFPSVQSIFVSPRGPEFSSEYTSDALEALPNLQSLKLDPSGLRGTMDMILAFPPQHRHRIKSFISYFGSDFPPWTLLDLFRTPLPVLPQLVECGEVDLYDRRWHTILSSRNTLPPTQTNVVFPYPNIHTLRVRISPRVSRPTPPQRPIETLKAFAEAVAELFPSLQHIHFRIQDPSFGVKYVSSPSGAAPAPAPGNVTGSGPNESRSRSDHSSVGELDRWVAMIATIPARRIYFSMMPTGHMRRSAALRLRNGGLAMFIKDLKERCARLQGKRIYTGHVAWP